MPTTEQLRAIGTALAILEALIGKFGRLDARVMEMVLAASSDQLQDWIPRVSTAATLEDVFG